MKFQLDYFRLKSNKIEIIEICSTFTVVNTCLLVNKLAFMFIIDYNYSVDYGGRNMKIKFIVIGAMTAVVIGTGIPIGIKLFGNNTKPNDQAVTAETPVLPRPNDGTTPLDYDILENVYIAAGVIKTEKKFKAVAEGHALTNMVITNDQFIHAERRVDGDYYMKETYTSSSFVKIASQRYYTENRVYIRDGKLTSTTSADWKDDCNPVSYEYIDEVIGVRPNLLCAYVINEKSVNLAESYVDTTNTEFDYVVHLQLDLEESVVQAKREIKFNSAAADYPKYSEVSCVIAMDKNWRVQQIISHDVYKIQINGLPTAAPVDSLLTENFYYDDYKIDEATKEFYKGFEDIDINDNPTKDKTGMDYLQEVGLGVVLGGSTLDADIQFGAYSLKGKVYLKFDLTTAEIKATALFDDLYLSYNKDLYISYRKYNYKLNESFIADLFKTLGVDIANLAGSIGGGDSSGTDDMLGDVVATKDDKGNVIVTTDIAIGEEKLTLTMNIFDENDTSTLKSISLTGSVGGENVAINVSPTSNEIARPDTQYVDLSDAGWMIDHITNMVSYTGYNFDLDYNYGDYDVNVKAALDSNKNVKVTAILDNKKVEPIVVEIYYYDGQTYVVYGNIGIQISNENIQDIIALITSYLELDQSSSKDFNVEDISSILSTVYDVFEGIEVGENKEVRISLALSNLYSSIKDVELAITENNGALNIKCDEYNLNLAVTSYEDTVAVPTMTFITVDEFTNFFDGVKSLVESSTHAIDIHDLVFKYGEFDLNINGSIDLSSDKANVDLSITGDVTVDLSLIYDQNEYYLYVTNEVTAIYLKASQEQMAKLISDLKAGLYQLSKDEELNLLIKQLLNDNNINLDNQEITPEIIIDTVCEVLTYVKGSSLTLVDNKLSFVGADNLTIAITKDDGSYKFDLSNFDYASVNLSTSLSISNNVQFTPVTDPDSYVSINKVLTAMDDIILALGELQLSVEDVVSYIEAVSNFKGYGLEADFEYLGYKVNLEAAIDSEGDIKLTASITNTIEETISLEVIRKDSVFYLVYGKTAFKITDLDIVDITIAIEKLINKDQTGSNPTVGDTIISGQTIDLASIITMVFDVYRGIEVNDDNSVSISLALSAIVPELSDIVINVSIIDNVVYGVVTAGEQVINIKMDEYTEDIKVDETLTYLDREDFEFVCGLVDEITTIIKNQEDINVAIDNMVVTYQGVSYTISGKVYYSVDKASLDISVVSEKINLTLNMILVDSEVYISIIYNGSKPIQVHGSKANMIDLITYIYDNRGSLIRADGSLDTKINELMGQIIPSNSSDMTSTLATIFEVMTYLKDATITISENGISLVFTNLFDIELNKVDNTYLATISATTTDLTIEASISLVKVAQLIVAPEAYVDIDPTIDIVFQVVQEFVKNNISIDDCIDLYNTLVGYEGYEVQIDSLYAMGFTVTGTVYVDSMKNVSLDLAVAYATDTISIRIEMFEGEYFLYWSNYCFNLTQQDLTEVLNFITSSSNVTETSFDLAVILDKITAVFQGLTINNGELNLSLAISKLYSELPDLSFTASMNDKLTIVSSDDYKLNLSISEFTGLVEHRSVSGLNYLTRTQYDKFYSYFNDVFNEVKDGAFRLDFKDVNVHMDGSTPEEAGTDITINGYIEIYMLPNDKVTFRAQLILTGAINFYVGATFGEDELLYLQLTSKYDAETLTPLTDGTMLKFTRDDIIQIITNVLNGIDEDTEIGKRLSTFAGVNIVKDLFLKLNILDENMTEIKGEGMSFDSIVKTVYKALAVIQDSKMIVQDNYINIAKTNEEMDVNISLNYNPLDSLYTVMIKQLALEGFSVNGAITISSYNEVCNMDTPENYTDMGGLPALTEALFNSIENMKFQITGTLQLKILGFPIDVKMEARIAYVDDAIQGYIYMNVGHVALAMDSFNSLEDYIYIDHDIIYMKRVKKYTQWFSEKTEILYRKATLGGFGKNILGENGHLDFLFSFSNLVTNAMAADSMSFTVVPEELFDGYSYNNETGVYDITLDLPTGLTTTLFSKLKISIGTATYPTLQDDGTTKDELYLRSLKGSVTIFVALSLTFDFVEEGCFGTPVDMTVVPTNLAEDANYAFYNE